MNSQALILSQSPTATILRFCADTIIKPDGSTVVLEIGAFPTSGFTGHDRHKPALSKRQEAMRDLARYAEKINVPLFMVGDYQLLNKEYRNSAIEYAGLFWDDNFTPDNFYSFNGKSKTVEDLIEHIRYLPDRGLDKSDIRNFRCIVVSFASTKLGLVGALFPQQSEDVLQQLRQLPGVCIVDDEMSARYHEIYDSKVITSFLLPPAYSPKTLLKNRVCTPSLAEELISYFAPATKILLKPSHSARGVGIVILNLQDKDELDAKLREIIDYETATHRERTARAAFKLDPETYPEQYWYTSNATREPTLIFQEFVESQPVEVDGRKYQSVTRFVFSCMFEDGHFKVMFHGRPYHKLAARPIDYSENAESLISKVHEVNGPEPVIVEDPNVIANAESNLRKCFERFCRTIVNYNSQQDLADVFIQSSNPGLIQYGLLLATLKHDMSPRLADIEALLTKHPEYVGPFLIDVFQYRRNIGEHIELEIILKQLMAANLIKAIQAININQYNPGYMKSLMELIQPDFFSMWKNADSFHKFKYFIAFVHSDCFNMTGNSCIYEATAPEYFKLFCWLLEDMLNDKDVHLRANAIVWCAELHRCSRLWDYGDPTEKHVNSMINQFVIQKLIEVFQREKSDSLLKSCILLFEIFYRLKIPAIKYDKSNDKIRAAICDYTVKVILSAMEDGFLLYQDKQQEIFLCLLYCTMRDDVARIPGSLSNPECLRRFFLITWLEKYTNVISYITNGEEQKQWQLMSDPFQRFPEGLSQRDSINHAWNMVFKIVLHTSNERMEWIQALNFAEFLCDYNCRPSYIDSKEMVFDYLKNNGQVFFVMQRILDFLTPKPKPQPISTWASFFNTVTAPVKSLIDCLYTPN